MNNTYKTNKTDWRRLGRSILLAALLLGASLPAIAADYVFTYNGGYLAVGDNGAVIYTTTFSPQCVWTCVDTWGNETSLSGTSTYLYTTDGNGTTRYLIGSTTDGAAITTSTSGTARWRANGTKLYWRNSNDYYAYYRENTWRTSRRTDGRANQYGVNAYWSGNGTGTDYRLTFYQVTTTTVTSTSSGPTINGADVLTATGNSTYTATGAAYRIGYTNYNFNSADHYVDADGNSFTGTPANATITNTWCLTDNAYATVNSTSGVVNVSSLPEYDIHLTLTVTATATGGNPAAPAGTTFTDTKTITIQGTKPSAPIISVSGNSATLTTDAPGSTTIRYTLDGSDPTTTTGTVYSGAIDLTTNGTSPVTIKAITVRNGNASDVSSEVVTLTLPEPTITINGEAQTATITSSVAGATIYYTTDGSTPTTSSSQYTGTLTGLTIMATVKAIAIKDGWNNSPVASGIVTIPSGVSGGVVTLFDYEPHSWSYYSDATLPEMMRSLNPADVKITYYGDGIMMTGTTDYTSGANTGWIRENDNNYVGNAKVNVGGENQNTFVYYKTLERTDGSTSANPTGRCPYTTIPNPFQVRPTYGSAWDGENTDSWTGWRGFQCWRLKSFTGGAVYNAGGDALSVGAAINAETEIYFAPTSEYGMAVELEAVWAIAYVVKANGGGANAIQTKSVGYERNFIVLHSTSSSFNFGGTSGKRITNINYPATVSTYYPDGTQGDNSGSSIRGEYDSYYRTYNLTLAANTKFENISFNMGSYTLTAANHSLTIGRGCSGTINYVSGINDDVTSPSYTLRLESGTINYLSFLRGYSTTTGTATDNGSTLGGTPNVKGVLGCDYDRATNSGITNNLIINNGAYYGYGVSENNTVYSEKSFVVHVKSGKIGNSFTINNSYTADAAQAFYIGVAANRVRGHRQLFLEGGEVASIAGGIDATQNQNNNSVTVRITGGHVRGAVYGGAARSAAYGNRNMIVTGGSITGWLGGGCNGEAYPQGQTSEDTYGGITYGATKVYFGGTATCGGTGSNVTINGSQGGIVFGAGKGVEGNTTSGRMSQGTTVVVADECDIERNVYGGGNFGYAQTQTDVYVTGGTVHGSVFGGSNQNNGPVVNVTMKGGTVEGDVYGGSNQSGNITGAVNVKVYGGTVNGAVYGCNNAGGKPTSTVNVDVYGTDDHPGDGTHYAINAVYGGGNQADYTYSAGPVVTIHGNCTGTEKDISIGEVYGGGNQAEVAKTTVNVYGGDTIGAVYAGANRANVNGTATLNVYGGTIKRVFPGNNNAGSISSTVTTTIDASVVEGGSTHCPMQIGAVFGGGNAVASAARTVNIVCTGDETEGIDTLFGGANAANITSNITLNVSKGHIRHGIYGGNNTSGEVGGNITVTVTKAASCSFDYPTIFGGGFGASTSTTGDVTVTIGEQDNTATAPTVNGDIYGGSALGNVNSDTDDNTTVNILNGTVNGNVYGGGLGRKAGGGLSAVAAKVNGTVTVNVSNSSQSEANCAIDLRNANIYGCNNANGSPQGNVTVHIYKTGHTTTDAATYTEDDGEHGAPTYAINQVFGGGNQADYAPENGNASSTMKDSVIVYGCTNSIRRLFSGGNAAAAVGVATTIYGGRFDWVFGGGNGESQAANIGNGGTRLIVHGGHINYLFGGSNTSGTISGAMRTLIDHTSPCEEWIGEFYGGGNKAPIEQSLTTTIGCGVGTIEKIYGGSKQAAITGDVTLNIKGGTFSKVFGGSQGTNSIAANITGNVTLNIYGGNIGDAFGGSDVNGNITGQINVTVDWYNGGDNCGGTPQLDNVYGGSNLAEYEPNNTNAISPLVTLTNGCVGRSDFDAADPGDHGRVFGGGKGDVNDIDAGKITANPKVLMNPTAGGALGVYDGTTKQGFLVKNALYGGGEVASVVGSTTVQINKGHVGCDEKLISHDNGFVFGGGKGFVGNYKLANVSKNSTVTMSGGYVHNSMFGGGEMASVGTFTYADQAYVDTHPTFVLGEQNDCTDGGTTTVTITGGQVGPKNVTMEADLGYVFGAGQGYYTQPKALGYADPSLSNEAAGLNNARFGYVNNAVVNISNTAFIVGAVWGGSENGQVLNNCRVNISGGQIGCGYNWSTHQGDDPYTKEQWNNAINAVKDGNIANIKTYAAQMRECNHVPYASPYLPYDAYIDEDIAAGTVTLVDASTAHPGDGHTFFGNVFGGGSGYYPYRITVKDSHDEDSTYSHFYDFQGRVRGNTYVTISDSAHVLTSIYGGCEYADVLGTSTVTMTGGTLGVPRTVDSILAHPVTCYLFGGGKGDQRTSFNDRANVGNGVVSISGDAFIFGSVFGGGEDGHVHENTSVSIAGNAWVGNWGTSYYDGNIFGGGRGFGGTTLNAGSISGNATVNIGGNCHILGNIYGGGRLASVGLNITHKDDPTYGQLLDDDGTHGVVTVNITGGTIGSLLEFAPATFSTETPYAVNDIVSYDNNIWRFKAPHAAGAWNDAHVDEITHTTGGNVFGSSMGRLLKVGESNDQVAANFNHLWPGLAKCLRTSVNISGTARIYGDVYGGGELGYVMKHTSVIIGKTGSPEIGYAIGTLPNRRYTGSVYGGGYGSNNIIQHTNDSASIGHDVTAAMHSGRVYGNTEVQMKGGQVWGNIYGGGEMASVGRRWINIALNGDNDNYIPNSTKDTIPYSADGHDYLSYPLDENIGVTNVTVSGGTVGDFTYTTVDTHREPGWVAGKTGGVFGGGKGHPGVQGSDFHYTRMAYVDSANVTMSGGRAVVLFGGGENGHVRYDTKVTVTGGTVGLALALKEYAMDKYGYCPYPIYQGNVYGGGRGVDRTSDDHLGAAAGQVFRNTNVTISGGTVHHNVYGGGSLATVGTPDGDTLVRGTGTATVTVYGTAVIGNNVSEGRNSGCVYGSGRGMAGAAFAHRAYVNNTYVTIGADDPGGNTCHIYGNVFGGGENGHVEGHTHVYIKPGCLIGELWYDVDAHDAPHEDFVGNVYGGGRGVDLATGQISRTAGWVRGSTHITVTGGHVYHNVFGGGSLANVGDTAALSGFAEYQDTMTVALGGTAYDYARHKHKAYNAEAFDTARANGHAYIWVSGGEIGTNGNANGCVFGGGRGNAGLSNYPFFESSFDPTGFESADSTFNYTGTPATYTIYFKLEDGKYTTYRKTKLSELGYQENDDIWIIGKKRNTTAERYQDSVTVRDYTNHTYVTGTHVVIDYPSIGGDSLTVSSAESDYADSLAQAASNTAGLEMVNGSVYGGGDNGHVRGKTEVLIKQGRIGTLTGQRNGNVFGGGSGEGLSYDGNFSEDAGRVYGSTSVTIDGGWILHNVYGGGNMAGVGDFDVSLDQDGNDQTIESTSKDDWLNGNGTVIGYTVHDGTTEVTINGGHIGEKFFDIVQNEKVDGKWVVRSGMDSRSANHGGNVFGSSRGQSLSNELVRKMAWVNLATVTVNNTNTPAIMGSVFGGGENGHVFYTATVNINGGTIGVPNQAASGDIFRGNVYGGGRGIDPVDGGTNFSRTSGLILGNTYVNMTDGLVYRNIFGGGSMATVGTYSYVDNNTSLQRIETVQGEEVVVNKDSIIDLQRPETGKTEVHISGGTVGINGINNGSVFGAGRGVAGLQGETMLDEHTYVDRTYVTISANADIKGGVFGSGDNGHVLHNTQVVISGGTIGVGNGPEEGNVFGSGRGADTYQNNGVPTFSPNAGRVHGNTNVYIVGGTIKNNVYGGGFLATVHGNTTITVDDSATVTQEVWEMQLDENDLPTIPALDEEHSHILVNPAQLPTVYGDIFGGSALGVLGTAGNTTVLNIMNGTIGHSDSYKYNTLGCGNIFGGGNGSTEGLMSSMIPSGKRDANVLNTVTVNIGKAAQQSNNALGPQILGYVFGGNNVAGCPMDDVNVNVYSTQHTANTNDFNALLLLNSDTLAALQAAAALIETPATAATGNALFALKAVYGGGNQADYVPNSNKKATVTIFGCVENTIKFVYGGGKAASVNETHVIVKGGHIYQAFAGGDGSAGAPGANIGYKSDGSTQYGAGTTHITIEGGAIYQVFGGSNTLGKIYGASTVELDKAVNCDLTMAEAFGGNNLAESEGDRTITIQCGSKWNDVYGGSNMAPHTGNIILNIVGGSMNRAFGGSKEADIDGNVTVNVTGGSIKQLFGGNNVGGNITGTITINVDCDPGNTCADERFLGTVYGGGKDAAYTPDSPTATPSVNIKCGTVSGDVFGGGLGSTANCTSNPKVLIGGDSGNKTVVVNGNVYGGGSAAPVTGSTSVETRSSNADSRTTTLQNNVYGGGLGSTATVSDNTDVKINGNGTLVNGSVYGGGNAGQVDGDTNVEIGEE